MSDKWTSRTLAERVEHFGHYVVDTPSLVASVNFIEAHMAVHGTAPEGELAFLVGPSRGGKTKAVDEFLNRVSDEIDGEIVSRAGGGRHTEATVSVLKKVKGQSVVRPVIKVGVANNPTPNGIIMDVLTAMEVDYPGRATEAEKQHLLGRQFAGQGTKLVIFDEVQHICESTNPRMAYKASEAFKNLAKYGRVQILAVGLPTSLEIIDANQQAEWLGGTIHEVRPLEITANPDSTLAKFVTALDAELPFDKPSALKDPAIFVPLAIYCDGLEGRIAVTLRKAISYAIRNGHPSLTREALAGYLRDERRTQDHLNPFVTNDDIESFRAKNLRAQQDRIREAEARRSSGSKRNVRSAFGVRGK